MDTSRPRHHIIVWQWHSIISYDSKENRDQELANWKAKFPEIQFTIWDGLIYFSN